MSEGEESTRDLEVLLPVIQEGCRLGLAPKLPCVNADRRAWLLKEAVAGGTEEDLLEDCRRAGRVTTLSALIAVYQDRVSALAESGEDVFTWRAALTVALAHRPRPVTEGAAS